MPWYFHKGTYYKNSVFPEVSNLKFPFTQIAFQILQVSSDIKL